MISENQGHLNDMKKIALDGNTFINKVVSANYNNIELTYSTIQNVNLNKHKKALSDFEGAEFLLTEKKLQDLKQPLAIKFNDHLSQVDYFNFNPFKRDSTDSLSPGKNYNIIQLENMHRTLRLLEKKSQISTLE